MESTIDPKKEITNEVIAMSMIHFKGNIIPHRWWSEIKREDSDLPDWLAINILADVCYWYRGKEVRDGKSSRWEKKFHGQFLHKRVSEYSELFGVSGSYVKKALDNLERLGLLEREIKHIAIKNKIGGTSIMNNVMFLKPKTSKIWQITKAQVTEPPISAVYADPSLNTEGEVGIIEYPSSPQCGSKVTPVTMLGHPSDDIYIEYNHRVQTESTQKKEEEVTSKPVASVHPPTPQEKPVDVVFEPLAFENLAEKGESISGSAQSSQKAMKGKSWSVHRPADGQICAALPPPCDFSAQGISTPPKEIKTPHNRNGEVFELKDDSIFNYLAGRAQNLEELDAWISAEVDKSHDMWIGCFGKEKPFDWDKKTKELMNAVKTQRLQK